MMQKCVNPGQMMNNVKKFGRCIDSKFLMWLYGEKRTRVVPSNPKEICLIILNFVRKTLNIFIAITRILSSSVKGITTLFTGLYQFQTLLCKYVEIPNLSPKLCFVRYAECHVEYTTQNRTTVSVARNSFI